MRVRDDERFSTGSVSHWFPHKSRDAFSSRSGAGN